MTGEDVVDAEIVDPGVLEIGSGFDAKWTVRHEETAVPDEPFSGWLDVSSDSRTRLVELGGMDLEPDEARNLARALILAADHAEDYPRSVMRQINELRCSNFSDRMGEQSNEAKRAAHDALQSFHNEAWRIHARAIEAQRKRKSGDDQ